MKKLTQSAISRFGSVFAETKRLKFGLSPELKLTNHRSAHLTL